MGEIDRPYWEENATERNQAMEDKYYFFSFYRKGKNGEPGSYGSHAGLLHPIKWQQRVDKEEPSQYVLLFWKEITKEEAGLYY